MEGVWTAVAGFKIGLQFVSGIMNRAG